MKKLVSLTLAVIAIALIADNAHAQFVNKFDTVYFTNSTTIRVINTFSGNNTTDTVWTRLKYSTNASMSGAVTTSLQKDGNATSKTTKRVITISPADYYFQLITLVTTSDTAGNLVVVRQDTSAIMQAITSPAIVSATMTPLLDGFRLSSTTSSGHDNATKIVTLGLDSLFAGSAVLDSTKFNSVNFADVDSAHGYSSSYFWIKLEVKNQIKTVQKVWKVTKLQAPKQAFVTKDSVLVTTTTATVHLKVVTYGLKTKVTIPYGTTSAYGKVAVDSLPGAQGESLIAITISGLTPGTTYHLSVVVKNSMPGNMVLPNFTATTDLFSQPFLLILDSVRFSPVLNGLEVYTNGKVTFPANSNLSLNLYTDSMLNSNYKSVPFTWGGKYHFIPGPFIPGRYFANISGFDWANGYSDQSDSMVVYIASANGIGDISKPIDFAGQYQLFDTMGKSVGGGDVQRGEVFSQKMRELALPLGTYVYRIHSDKGQQVLSGKVMVR